MPVTGTPATQRSSASDWRPFERGTMKGWLTLTLPSKMIVRDCSLPREPDGRRWIGLPAKKYDSADGSSGWSNLVDFADKAAYRRFQDAALKAFDCYRAAQPVNTAAAATPRKQAADDSIGFDDLEPLDL